MYKKIYQDGPMIPRQNDRKKTGIFQFLCVVVKLTHCVWALRNFESVISQMKTLRPRGLNVLFKLKSLLEAESMLPLFEYKNLNIFYKLSSHFAKQNKNSNNNSYHLLSIYSMSETVLGPYTNLVFHGKYYC